MSGTTVTPVIQSDYATADTEAELRDAVSDIRSCYTDDPLNSPVCDLETFPKPVAGENSHLCDAADRFTNSIVGIALTWKDNQGLYIPIAHNDGDNIKFDRIVESVEDEVLKILAPVFSDLNWTNHFIRYDKGNLELQSKLDRIPFFTLPPEFKRRNTFINYKYCTYVEAFISGMFNELRNSAESQEVGTDIGLKSLVYKIFGYQMQELKELAKFADGYHPERVSAKDLAWYACDDSRWDREVHKFLWPIVKNYFMLQVEMGITMDIEDMETVGIPYDIELSRTQVGVIDEFQKRLYDTIMAQVERQLGYRHEVNLGSPKKVGYLLYELLKLPVLGYTKGSRGKRGKDRVPSTDKKVLAKLSKDFDIPHNITEYRRLTTAGSTFFDSLPSYVHPLTRCIHSTFHQGGVPTGRFASSNPNAQNWSDLKKYLLRDSGTEEKLELNVRDCVSVPEDEILLIGDYKQVEFWTAAEEAQEIGMLDAIEAGYDAHVATASLVYQLPIDAVPDEFRKKGKTRNFALLYGESPQGMSEKEGCTLEEAIATFAILRQRLGKIVADRDATIARGRAVGWVFTHFGRPIELKSLYDNPSAYISGPGGHADRFAYNGKIQGTAADIVKIGMYRITKAVRPVYPYLSMCHQGHDSLMFRHKIKLLNQHGGLSWFVDKLKGAMEYKIKGYRLLPRVDFKVGSAFGSMVSYKEGMSCEDVINAVAAKTAKRKLTPDMEAPQRLRVIIEGEVGQEQLLSLKGLLTSNVGKNIIYLEYKGKVKVLETLPTSIGLKDAQTKFAVIVPCRVVAESAEDHMQSMVNQMKMGL